MQKFYLTKCVMIGLSIAGTSLLGMHKTTAAKQEKAINSYLKDTAAHNFDHIEAKQQENHIIWYTSAISQNNTKKAQSKFTRKHI